MSTDLLLPSPWPLGFVPIRRHLSRKAIVYLRQSSDKQVRLNKERLIWLILHQGVRYEERGTEVSKRTKQLRTWKMIRQLRKLGYRVDPPNPQPSQAQAQ